MRGRSRSAAVGYGWMAGVSGLRLAGGWVAFGRGGRAGLFDDGSVGGVDGSWLAVRGRTGRVSRDGVFAGRSFGGVRGRRDGSWLVDASGRMV